jgi:hypothetical protein
MTSIKEDPSFDYKVVVEGKIRGKNEEEVKGRLRHKFGNAEEGSHYASLRVDVNEENKYPVDYFLTIRCSCGRILNVPSREDEHEGGASLDDIRVVMKGWRCKDCGHVEGNGNVVIEGSY